MLKKEVVVYFGTGSNGGGHFNKCPELHLLMQLLTPAPLEGAVGHSLQSHSSGNDWELALLLFDLNGTSFLVVIQSSFRRILLLSHRHVKLNVPETELLIPSPSATF